MSAICDLDFNEEQEEESLLGLKVAFYENKSGILKPSDYFFMGHVSEVDTLPSDESLIGNPIKVVSLNGETYRYFGFVTGDVYRLLVEDLFGFGELVIHSRGPSFFCDILS